MKNIENIKNNTIKILTLPVRIGIGMFNAVINHMPDKIELPFEIRVKEKNDNRKTD
jgi:hypothetical protein